ncbi:MAG: hypothetical protein ACO1OC_05335 [Tuberibacillus sp.]
MIKPFFIIGLILLMLGINLSVKWPVIGVLMGITGGIIMGISSSNIVNQSRNNKDDK